MLPLGIAYFAIAGASIAFTRFDGGVASLWAAAAILIAALVRLPRRRWPAALLVCALANVPATILWGLGWLAAVPFAIINMGEAALAAWLIKSHRQGRYSLGSLGWFGRFVLAAGLVAPIAAASMVALYFLVAGTAVAPVEAGLRFFTGHALGNLSFTPLALLLSDRRKLRQMGALLRDRKWDALVTLGAVTAATVVVFAQNRYPLLFLPVFPMILAAFRLGRLGAAASVAILAVVGGLYSAAGSGPMGLIAGGTGERLIFFQFYLAASVMTVLPVAASLEGMRRLHELARAGEARFRMLAEHSTDIIMHVSTSGIVRYVSPSVRQLGFVPDDMIGKPALAFVAAGDRMLADTAHQAAIANPGETYRSEYRARAADGSERWFESHARAIADDDGRPQGLYAMARDMTARKAFEAQLSEAAMSDPLTGLANRRAFRDTARRLEFGKSHYLALFDLDHFKQINDRHGHEVGDQALKAFAEIARQSVRSSDLVARIGGEEFAVLLPDTNLKSALEVCERLRAAVARTQIATQSGPIGMTVSGGVTVIGANFIDLALEQSDMALYRAKQGGRDQLAMAA